VPKSFQNIVQNFKAGVLSPRLSAGVEFDAYKNALLEGINWIISPQGTALFREGFETIGVPPSNQPFRIFQFRRGGDASDILIEVSEGLTRFWIEGPDGTFYLFSEENVLLTDEDDDFILIDEDDGAELTAGVLASSNPYSLEDLEGLYFTNQADFGILCHSNHPPQVMTLFFDGSLVSISLSKENIPLFNYNDIRNPGFASTSGSWRINFPADWAVGQYAYYLTYNGVTAKNANGSVLTYTFDNTTAVNNQDNIDAGLLAAAQAQGLATTFVTALVTSAGTEDLTYDVTVSGEQGGWEITVVRTFPYFWGNFDPTEFIAANSPVVQNLNISKDTTEEPAWSYPAMVINEVPASSGTFRYYRVRVTHISSAPGTGPDTNEPGIGDDWEDFWVDLGLPVPVGYDYQYPGGNPWKGNTGEGGTAYSPLGRGFPTVAAFHDQRLIYMANRANPTALYGSAIGRYSSYEPGPEDDQPFIFVLDSSDTPAIKWAVSHLDLLLGTSSGDWRVDAEVTITPTDIQANKQNAARSQLAMATQIDTEIFYIEQGGQKLRVTRYVRDLTSFSSTDASLLAENLVSDSGIKRVTTSYLPEIMLSMVRNDGRALFMTYTKEMNMMAYTEVETDGFVNDVAAYYSLFNKQDYTFWAVQRNGQYVLEKMRYPCGKVCTPLTDNGIVCMDSWVSGIVSGFEITGLDLLNGKEVGVLIDDAWQIKPYLVANGKITLPEDFTGRTYAVGLLYEGYLETFENPDNFQGTGLGTDRKWTQLYTRLLNSSLPKVYGQRAPDRTPIVPMGTSENVRPGLQDIEQNVLGFGSGSIKVLQDRPYPTQVLAFFGTYQVEDD
jgi:hypothetical protein